LDEVERTTAVKWKKPYKSKKDGKEYEGYHLLRPDRKEDKGIVSVVNSANEAIAPDKVWRNSMVRAAIGVAYTNSGMYQGLTLYLQGLQLLATPDAGTVTFDDVSEQFAPVGDDGKTKTEDSDEVPFDAE